MLMLPACADTSDEVETEFRSGGWWKPGQPSSGEPDVMLFAVDEDEQDEIEDDLIWDIQDHIHVLDPFGTIVLVMDGNFLLTPTDDPDDPDGLNFECVVVGDTIGVPQLNYNRRGHPELSFEPLFTVRGNKLLEGDGGGWHPEVAYSLASRWMFEGRVRDREFVFVADKPLTASNRFRKLLLGVLASRDCGIGPVPQ